MKHFRLLALVLIIGALLLLGACRESEAAVDTPRGVRVDYDTGTLLWRESEGASTYVIAITGEGGTDEITVSKNYYSLLGLSPGEYEITVRARHGDTVSRPSDTVEFIREKENGLVFKLINGGREYEVSGKGDATGVIEVPATYRTKPVTAIGESAFSGQSDVREVYLPSGIRSIGAYAFASCSYLEKINLPDGISSLGESAFSGCRALSGELLLPISLTEIPKGAFAYCSALETVALGPDLKSIGERAFTDCSSLLLLELPSSLEEIGDFAFAACADLESVRFNEGLLKIGDFAFSKALSLGVADLPESLCEIGQGAFYYCSALETVSLGGSIRVLGDTAFLDSAVYLASPTNEIYIGNWFVGLADVTAPRVEIREGTVGIADGAFFGNKYLNSVILPSSVRYVGSLSFAASAISSVVIGEGTEYIADRAFLQCERLTFVYLGSFDGITGTVKKSALREIGDYAFMGCTLLENIDIPDTVTDIGAYAFRNTAIFNSAHTGAVYADNWLVDFTENLPSELTVYPTTVGIARYAFYNCAALTSVSLPDTVKHIGRGAFYNCSALESVYLPGELTRIEDYTFYSCVRLKLTSLPPSLRVIGRAAFYKCGTVDNYTVDTAHDRLELLGVKYVGDFAFYGAGYRATDGIDGNTLTRGIDIIALGNEVEYIGRCAFYGFASLREVEIGWADSIGDKAFYKCPSLERVTVRGGLSTVGDMAFYRCPSLGSVSLPDTTREIGERAFYRCDSLTEVKLGTGLRKIGDGAFSGDKMLTFIYIPASVEYIGSQAFRDCDALGSVVIGASVEHIGEHAFYSCDGLTVYTEHTEPPATWETRWNSSFAPVVWGVGAPEGFVVSAPAGAVGVSNLYLGSSVSAPRREGYIFLGWRTAAGDVLYTADELPTVTVDGTLYSDWAEK